MDTINEPAIAIMLTIHADWLIKKGNTPESYLQQMMSLNDNEESVWVILNETLPTQNVSHVYVVFDDKVQLRANLLYFKKNEAYTASDTIHDEEQDSENKNWIVLSAPVVKAPVDIPMEDFQGFKYLTKELF